MNWLKRALTVFLATTISAAGAITGNPDIAVANEGCETGIGDRVPVVQIHGFDSSSEAWDSMGTKLEEIDEIFPVRFDYRGAVSKEWVTHEKIGPKLARFIDCLAQASLDDGGVGKVVVLAHSMGGLATRYAVNQTVDGRPVADEVGLVVTIGTPHKGSDLAWLCEWLGLIPQCRGSASSAMKSGSSELADLPEFPDSIPVRAIAGDVTIHDKLFDAKYTLDLNSDVVVKVDSATAFYSETGVGDDRKVFECDGKYKRVLTVITGVEASCEHTTMLSTSYVQEDVVRSIKAYLASQHVKMTNLHGLKLPLNNEWELSYQTLNQDEEWPFSTVVKTDLCDQEQEANDYCPNFKVIDTTTYEEQLSSDYPGKVRDCFWYGLRDDSWQTSPQSTEKVTIGGKSATHRTHWECDVNGSSEPSPPSSASEAKDVMHSWEVDGIVIVEYFDSDDPLPGLKKLLAGASWS